MPHSIPPSALSKQAGAPVLVISRERLNQLLPVVNVVPLTSRKSPQRTIYPNEVLLAAGITGLTVSSIVLCYQIRTLDKRRLERRIGVLDDPAVRTAVAEALRLQLDL